MAGSVPILIVAGIVIVLVTLACYALFVHSVHNRREKQRLLISSLKNRCRKIEEINSCFPAKYLGSNLTIIMQMALVQSLEELSKLQPESPEHARALKTQNEFLMAIKGSAQENNFRSLKNPKQIGGTRKNMQLMHKFINQLHAKGSISDPVAAQAKEIIKFKMVLLVTDEHDIRGDTALSTDKSQLAAHCFNQARELLIKHNNGSVFNEHIKQHTEWVMDASNRAKVNKSREEAEKEALEGEKRWEEESWKKKNIYD